MWYHTEDLNSALSSLFECWQPETVSLLWPCGKSAASHVIAYCPQASYSVCDCRWNGAAILGKEWSCACYACLFPINPRVLPYKEDEIDTSKDIHTHPIAQCPLSDSSVLHTDSSSSTAVESWVAVSAMATETSVPSAVAEEAGATSITLGNTYTTAHQCSTSAGTKTFTSQMPATLSLVPADDDDL